jgi:hypothetical protein
MDTVKIQLSGLWVVLMLIYLLGDVLRLMSGDVTRMSEMNNFTQWHWLGIAALMLIPILMVYVSLTVQHQPFNRWANIIVAGLFFLLNVSSVHTYPSMYDKFLLVVSLVFNLLTIWQAWRWKA